MSPSSSSLVIEAASDALWCALQGAWGLLLSSQLRRKQAAWLLTDQFSFPLTLYKTHGDASQLSKTELCRTSSNRTMKLLVLVATLALVTCESSSDNLSEMREEFAQMKA
jgi:hypothetical protein